MLEKRDASSQSVQIDTDTKKGKCPVCYSQKIKFIRKLKRRRTKNEVNLFKCHDCGSLHNFSGYKEDEKQLIRDRDYHIKVFERRMAVSGKILTELLKYNPSAKNLLDVGAGIGALMMAGFKIGLNCYGVEPNKYAVTYAKEKFSINILNNFYHSSLFDTKFDIITIIHVLEHLEEPAKLFQEAIKDLNDKGILFVSVPMYHPIKHAQYIENPDAEGSIFLPDVHIIHFTDVGIKKMAKKFGAASVNKIYSGASGYIINMT
jgi:2-polyprenyl-3-methyl-5-hydroxy-6-metoxy-1,4-benzoquinol methylase